MKQNIKTVALSLVCVLGGISLSNAQKAPQLGKASLDEVIAAMTAEEKAELLIGPGMPGYAGLVPLEGEPDVRVLGAAGGNAGIERLGIPETVFADGPAGLRIQPKREGH